jgi:hypothetical protein
MYWVNYIYNYFFVNKTIKEQDDFWKFEMRLLEELRKKNKI